MEVTEGFDAKWVYQKTSKTFSLIGRFGTKYNVYERVLNAQSLKLFSFCFLQVYRNWSCVRFAQNPFNLFC